MKYKEYFLHFNFYSKKKVTLKLELKQLRYNKDQLPTDLLKKNIFSRTLLWT